MAEYIADLTTDDLIAASVLSPQDAASLLAERELIKCVRDLVDAEKAEDTWTEHVTLSIFERIKTEFSELYEQAIGTGFSGQVNRRIGALVKRRLDATDRRANGKPLMANVSRGSASLIKAYTLLYRKPQETAE